jgi:outer membrane protein OmpA-like peptidoglycan-associated protein
MRKILAFITFLLFLLLLWYSYNKYQDCCNKDKNVTEQRKTAPVTKHENKTKKEQVKEVKDGSLLFNWNSDIAHENEYWKTKKTNILSGIADGKILKILGPYFKEEGKEMGIKRAKAAYAKLSDKVNAKKVEFGSKLINYHDDAKIKPFSGTNYLWLIRNENITEIDNKALIYFPTNSTKKISNSNIINYLKNVVKSLKNNNKKVYLSGHSDSRGNANLNKKLALGRANSIKEELIHLGLSADKISTISYGEEKPIASNNTKEGQQKNRRVELEIK